MHHVLVAPERFARRPDGETKIALLDHCLGVAGVGGFIAQRRGIRLKKDEVEDEEGCEGRDEEFVHPLNFTLNYGQNSFTNY